MSIDKFKTYRIDAPFGSLAYHCKGNFASKSAFIFLHGHLDSALENNTHQIFDYHEDVLQVLLDHRWHGASTRIEYYPSITERAEDIDILLHELVKQFPQLKNIHLIGYSQGGSVLLCYLLHKKNFAQKSMVTSTFIVGPRFDLKGYLKWFEKELEQIRVGALQHITKKYRSKGYIKYSKRYIRELGEMDFKKLIKHLTIPSVLIRGENDDLISKADSELLIDGSNGLLSYYEVAGCGHNPEVKHWQQINDFIYDRVMTDTKFNVLSPFKWIQKFLS
jgi:pimeloyl-ACP methyl ester carboxylesterase